MNPLYILAVEVSVTPADNANWPFIAIATLWGALTAVVVYQAARVKANEKKCEDDRKECKDSISGYHKKIEALHLGLITEQAERAAQNVLLLAANQKALERTSESLDRNTDIIAVLGKTDQRRRE